MRKITWSLIVLVGLLLLPNFVIASDMRAVISWGTNKVTVEVAETFKQRQKGLQHRESLCGSCGMLFVFETERVVNFWMKDTSIPLDIAYIDNDGYIKAIKPLEPFNTKTVSSDTKVKYALEMNRGWFAKNSLSVNDRVTFDYVTDVDRVAKDTH